MMADTVDRNMRGSCKQGADDVMREINRKIILFHPGSPPEACLPYLKDLFGSRLKLQLSEHLKNARGDEGATFYKNLMKLYPKLTVNDGVFVLDGDGTGKYPSCLIKPHRSLVDKFPTSGVRVTLGFNGLHQRFVFFQSGCFKCVRKSFIPALSMQLISTFLFPKVDQEFWPSLVKEFGGSKWKFTGSPLQGKRSKSYILAMVSCTW